MMDVMVPHQRICGNVPWQYVAKLLKRKQKIVL
jgi:hypothetical protein